MTLEAEFALDEEPAVRTRSRQTLANIAWNYASGLLSVFGLVLLYPLAVHASDAATYGVWIVCFGMVQLLILADLGMGTGILRAVAAARATGTQQDVSRAASLGLTLFGALAIGLGLIFATVLPFYLGILQLSPHASRQLPSLVVVAVLALVLGVFGRGANSVLWGDNRYDIERKWAMASLIGRAAFISAWAVGHAGILAVAITEATSVVLPGLACVVIVIRWHAPRIVSKVVLKTEGIPLLRFSSKVFVGAFASILAVQIPFYIAAPALTLVQITALGAWLRLYQGVRMLFSWMANPFLAVAAANSIKPTEAARRSQARLYVASLVMAGLVAGPLIAIPKQLVTAWLGSDFAFASTSFSLIAVSALGMALAIPGSVLATAHGRPGPVAMLNVLWCGLTLLAVLLARGGHSLTTVSACIAVPLALLGPIYFYQSRKVTDVRLSRGDLKRVAEATVVLVLATLVIFVVARHAQSRVQVLVGLLAYSATAGIGAALLLRDKLASRWAARRSVA